MYGGTIDDCMLTGLNLNSEVFELLIHIEGDNTDFKIPFPIPHTSTWKQLFNHGFVIGVCNLQMYTSTKMQNQIFKRGPNFSAKFVPGAQIF